MHSRRRLPSLTSVEPLFGLRHHERDVVRGVLKDLHGAGVREPAQAGVVDGDQTVACTDTTAVTHRRQTGSRKAQQQRCLIATEVTPPDRPGGGGQQDAPGLREPLTSAGPPGVMELMMVPRSARPESSPPTTWKPRQHTHTHTSARILGEL